MVIIGINHLKSNESGRHFKSKELLYTWILEGKAILYDTNRKFLLDTKYIEWDFASMEAYLFDGVYDNSFYQPFNLACFDYCNEYTYDHPDYEKIDDLEVRFDIEQFEANKIQECKETYYYHPCRYCKKNSKAKVKFIFDIGFSVDQHYYLVIEVVNKYPVKNNKIKYCKDNGITLLSIDYKEILRMNKPDDKLNYFNVDILNHGFILDAVVKKNKKELRIK